MVMAATVESRTLSVRIERPWREVYDFTAAPANFAAWAKGLGDSLERIDGRWITRTASGPLVVRFTDRNDFGILDHAVTTSAGVEIYVPLRVIANGGGSEVMLTLLRLPDMSDEAFAADAAAIQRDLQALKALMER
jgi:hypothetical protein